MTEHLLIEHVTGFELFELKAFESLAQNSYNDYMALTQVVNHVSSLPIEDINEIVSTIKNLENGEISEKLKNFLQINNVKILHCDKSLKNGLKDINIEQKSSLNITRGVKLNLSKFIENKNTKQIRMSSALNLAKENIKYDLEREDNIVIPLGYEIDNIEKDIDNLKNKVNKMINWYIPGNTLSLEELYEKVETFKEIPIYDITVIKEYLKMIVEKEKLYKELEEYLAEKMKILAPNLRHILDDKICCKMIHKAGGLMNLCLYPSSTLQLLGAEKSLFRSLKMKTRTPKYGLLYQLSYINHSSRYAGRVCRFIATKCSIAARIDCFSEDRSGEYGKELRKLIDKKIQSYKKKDVEVESTAEVMKRVEKRLIDS